MELAACSEFKAYEETDARENDASDAVVVDMIPPDAVVVDTISTPDVVADDVVAADAVTVADVADTIVSPDVSDVASDVVRDAGPPDTGCGSVGQTCCLGNCGPGATCRAGMCAACGGAVGVACCPTTTAVGECGPALGCYRDVGSPNEVNVGVCSCGHQSQYCCAGSVPCVAGLRCLSFGHCGV